MALDDYMSDGLNLILTACIVISAVVYLVSYLMLGIADPAGDPAVILTNSWWKYPLLLGGMFCTLATGTMLAICIAFMENLAIRIGFGVLLLLFIYGLYWMLYLLYACVSGYTILEMHTAFDATGIVSICRLLIVLSLVALGFAAYMFAVKPLSSAARQVKEAAATAVQSPLVGGGNERNRRNYKFSVSSYIGTAPM